MLSFLLFISSLQAIDHLALSEGVQKEALPFLIAVTPEQDAELYHIAELLAQNIQRSGQFRVKVKGCTAPSTASELEKLLDKSYPLELFLSQSPDKKHVQWRLYDVHDGHLIKGKSYAKRGTLAHGYAAHIADELWPVLTKQSSSFSTKIAYVKRKIGPAKRQRSVVCVVNSDGSFEQEIIKKPGTYVSLYWHHNTQFPCLFCSEFTRSNVRLISVTLQGKKTIVLNLNGTCVGISVSHDNNKAVYCRSGTIWQYSYDEREKKGLHTPVIKNDGKNVSPTLLANGDIIFCTDSRKIRQGSSGPQICRYSPATNSIKLLTQDGYCVGPSYCAQNDKIAYSKRIQGVMQLCIYDCKTHQQYQLTSDSGNKIDCCWSPCGNYLVYCFQQGRESRIALMHVVMKKRTFITSLDEYCTCPSWSPVFDTLPVLGY